ncbi:GtrA family protein [Ligilactobacillus sp. Marseille-Q7487]|uniref:GtrA family protein n=1 Tax=Ligilactobacillus sp. Marseille-Q7487 TaxID=3022128 RepID=UPI0024A9BDFF|nr:GtrA family protein [Ligilactobacillus sp. Marseille-Q7487]
METIKDLFVKYKSVLAYLFFGGLTTLVNLITFYIFDTKLGIYYQIANFIAWFISVLFAFVTNKLWVFESKTPTIKAFLVEMWWFFFYRIVSFFFDAAIMYIGVSLLALNSNLTKLIDQVVIVLLNYLFSKLFIFKDRS